MTKTAIAALPPEIPNKTEVLLNLGNGFTEELWAAVRKLTLLGEINQQEWRQYWRQYHPKGK